MSVQDIAQQIDAACRLVAVGRAMARQLGNLVRSHGINEAEFRLLWLLLDVSALDQKHIAQQLGLSTAQVSGLVERLRRRGLLVASSVSGDRRRQLWQLSLSGKELAQKIVADLRGVETMNVLPPLARREVA